MRNSKFILRFVLAIAFGFTLFITSCTKDKEDLFSEGPQQDFTVRPDFATLDTRPQSTIQEFTLTNLNTKPATLDLSKAGGKYAVVIGISDYEGTANDLNYCDDDAQDWKTRLTAEGYNVTLLLDRNATASNIDAALTDLAALSSAGNEIAFCYSGHGSKGNIISTDLYYIGTTWFQTKFANANSTKMMFCFDACQIGDMEKALNAPGRIVITASGKNNYSYDGDATMKNGVFTYYQMEAFDDLGYIYVEPVCDYAIAEMIAWAKVRHIRVSPSYVDSYSGDMDL